MGHFRSQDNSQIVQSLTGTLPIFGMPAWWNNTLYMVGSVFGSSTTFLSAYTFDPVRKQIALHRSDIAIRVDF